MQGGSHRLNGSSPASPTLRKWPHPKSKRARAPTTQHRTPKLPIRDSRIVSSRDRRPIELTTFQKQLTTNPNNSDTHPRPTKRNIPLGWPTQSRNTWVMRPLSNSRPPRNNANPAVTKRIALASHPNAVPLPRESPQPANNKLQARLFRTLKH